MESRDSIKDIWGKRQKYDGDTWPERVDMHLADQPDKWVQSACVLCSNGCALDIGVKEGKIVGVRGRGIDRVNKGRLGPKGLHGWQANNSTERLTRPLIRRGGKLVEASWKEAMQLIVDQVKSLKEEYGAGSLGFYNTGQLFLEEYYTLSLITKAGLGTNHVDGNTRLCTATASQALKETFGSDGQPGSYTDFDLTECILHAGHNVADTQTVLWSRILDRRRSANPPKLIVIDPRTTDTAREADIHLAPRVGTNLALMNGLINLIIEKGYIDEQFIAQHTTGFDRLREVCANYSPLKVEEITGVPARQLEKAANMIGKAQSLVSTVLQGFYQSNQATAASCQVNNLNLIRGMIGKPGCTVFQMNGQPTAQNTRETGCNGEFPLFANFHNQEHMKLIAERWNVDLLSLPTWHLPSHAMEIFHYADTGSIKFLWVIGTNPAVSLPELHRIRKILAQPQLFVVVSDAFLTETAVLADVVLPAAIWGEKTGTFTNTDRTVHLSRQAVNPPGEAKSDLDIFLEFARLMNFQDRDGAELIKWEDAESAFDHWAQFSRGAICDYSGLSYKKLSGSGIQWPCNAKHKSGTERLYTDSKFPTTAEVCETFGHDLETGAAIPQLEYRANDPKGRAILKSANYKPPMEDISKEFPFWLMTGRVVYQFHTRTKTGRAQELNAAAPDVYAQISESDAKDLNVSDGDLLDITSMRGSVRAKAKIGAIIAGHIFIPFHYGYWDEDGQHNRAANEMTATQWDPVSKQPYFKTAAVRVAKATEQGVIGRFKAGLEHTFDQTKEGLEKVAAGAHLPRRRVADSIGMSIIAQENFVASCAAVSTHHFEEAELLEGLKRLSEISKQALDSLKPFTEKYGQHSPSEVTRLLASQVPPLRAGQFGLLRDLQNLVVATSELHVLNTSLAQASRALRDPNLLRVCDLLDEGCKRQAAWLNTQIEHKSAHAIVTKY